MNQEEGETSRISKIKHQPPESSGGKEILRQAATSSDESSAATSGRILDRSQSAENLQVEPSNGIIIDGEAQRFSESSGSISPVNNTIPSSMPRTNTGQSTAMRPTRRMIWRGEQSIRHLLSSNSASATDESMYIVIRLYFGKGLANHLASEFGWQVSERFKDEAERVLGNILPTSHERDHDP